MKYRIISAVAHLLGFVSAFMPSPIRHFLRKVRQVLYFLT